MGMYTPNDLYSPEERDRIERIKKRIKMRSRIWNMLGRPPLHEVNKLIRLVDKEEYERERDGNKNT